MTNINDPHQETKEALCKEIYNLGEQENRNTEDTPQELSKILATYSYDSRYRDLMESADVQETLKFCVKSFSHQQVSTFVLAVGNSQNFNPEETKVTSDKIMTLYAEIKSQQTQ
jgi:hypothetical protein